MRCGKSIGTHELHLVLHKSTYPLVRWYLDREAHSVVRECVADFAHLQEGNTL